MVGLDFMAAIHTIIFTVYTVYAAGIGGIPVIFLRHFDLPNQKCTTTFYLPPPKILCDKSPIYPML